MAEGRSNSAIADALELSPGTLERRLSGVFAKLDVPAAAETHRRVLAVLKYLHSLP